jgi:tetratricopeptide (TPR) repeat protein
MTSPEKMTALEAELRSLLAVESLDGLGVGDALDHLARLIDLSFIFKSLEGTNRAIECAEGLGNRQLTPVQTALLNYYLSNAWANRRQLDRQAGQDEWKWEQPEVEKQIIHLRRALVSDGFPELDMFRRCRILTNIGNLLNTVGRFVEAIGYWDEALAILPSFGMAQGNRGYGLTFYARAVYDEGHRPVFLRHAYVGLRAALSSDRDDVYGVDASARDGFSKEVASLESTLVAEYLSRGTSMEEFPLGDSEDEIRYRQWCLHNRLFLNPLNDLGPYSIAARDVLTTPSIVVKVGEGMHFQGFYNQLKQEYTSARYLYYEGATSTTPHFSDKGVLLINTLDYPCYSLAAEKVKVAFRMAYSLLDKVSFFLNHYLALGIPERRVRFRSFWYAGQERQRGLRPEFDACDNWSLRGLFWLSKDLFENAPEFRECLEPDAQELDSVRNHAEHKYLKLHENLWSGPTDEGRAFGGRTDMLAFSVYRSHFTAKAFRLLGMARAALIYLSLAIHCEERKREQARPKKGLVMPMPVDTWEDEWKR